MSATRDECDDDDDLYNEALTVQVFYTTNYYAIQGLRFPNNSFEGVCVNYRHPGPRRGEPRVGSGPDIAF